MRITKHKRNHYRKVLLKALLVFICVTTGMVASWRCCLRRMTHAEKRESYYLYLLNRDMEAGEILEEADLSVRPVLCKNQDMKNVPLKAFVGKQVKFALRQETILSEDLVTVKDAKVENLRKICYSYIRNAYELGKGDCIDVRISFPNGADFIVLSKKEVLRTENNEHGISEGIWLSVTEEELLRMSSGVVDASMLDGAYIYATIYMNSLQKESIVNYPVNEVVKELIKKNPNIITIAQERKTFELRNRIFEQNEDTREKREEIPKQEEGLVYFE